MKSPGIVTARNIGNPPLTEHGKGWLDNVFGRINARYEAVGFAKLAEDTRDAWEPLGYHVHVNTNARRITITPRSERV